MIDYRAGVWGLHVAFGWKGSLAPRSLVMAVPNAVLTLILSYVYSVSFEKLSTTVGYLSTDTVDHAAELSISFTAVMLFILYNRSRTSYNRWWEGGTLLQKTRGEWFNAYSSIMAFTSTKPELQGQVEAYCHFMARLMSLLMCSGLQQVSPNRDRAFEIINVEGIEPESLEFLSSAPDKVEIILQWIQRSMVLHQQTGVLPVAPPILSRAFQEVSRGIVNLQNARKIADFPYPYPLAQISMILQLLHWSVTPLLAAVSLPMGFAVLYSFSSIFVLWCIHFNALDLEFPFGVRENDLPMNELQRDWNASVCALMATRARTPPRFEYDPELHDSLSTAWSDGSEAAARLKALTSSRHMQKQRKSLAQIKARGVGDVTRSRDLTSCSSLGWHARSSTTTSHVRRSDPTASVSQITDDFRVSGSATASMVSAQQSRVSVRTVLSEPDAFRPSGSNSSSVNEEFNSPAPAAASAASGRMQRAVSFQPSSEECSDASGGDDGAVTSMHQGNLWKLTQGMDNQQSLHGAWQPISCATTHSVDTVCLAYLAENDNGRLSQLAVLHSAKEDASAELVDYAPVNMESLSNEGRLELCSRLHTYYLAIRKPTCASAAEYASDIPETLYPFSISWQDAADGVQTVTLAASSASDRSFWLNSLTTATARRISMISM